MIYCRYIEAKRLYRALVGGGKRKTSSSDSKSDSNKPRRSKRIRKTDDAMDQDQMDRDQMDRDQMDRDQKTVPTPAPRRSERIARTIDSMNTESMVEYLAEVLPEDLAPLPTPTLAPRRSERIRQMDDHIYTESLVEYLAKDPSEDLGERPTMPIPEPSVPTPGPPEPHGPSGPRRSKRINWEEQRKALNQLNDEMPELDNSGLDNSGLDNSDLGHTIKTDEKIRMSGISLTVPKGSTPKQILLRLATFFSTVHLFEKTTMVVPDSVKKKYSTPKPRETRNRRPYHPGPYLSNWTHVLVTPSSNSRMRKLLDDDDDMIERLYESELEKDTDYIFDKEFGKTIETWIADNFNCPGCGRKTLRRYVPNNMPVVDVVCINPLHGLDDIKLFQIKASDGSPFMGMPYFDVTDRYIHTGSARLGGPIHSIRPTDRANRMFQIGYICVLVAPRDDLDPDFHIKKIITIVPNLKHPMNVAYYTYIHHPSDSKKRVHPMITWNQNNNAVTVKVYRGGGVAIPKDYSVKNYYDVVDNPLNKKNTP